MYCPTRKKLSQTITQYKNIANYHQLHVRIHLRLKSNSNRADTHKNNFIPKLKLTKERVREREREQIKHVSKNLS